MIAPCSVGDLKDMLKTPSKRRLEGFLNDAFKSITFGATCDSFARMHSGTCLAGREAIEATGQVPKLSIGTAPLKKAGAKADG
jgi:hypothetical protein